MAKRGMGSPLAAVYDSGVASRSVSSMPWMMTPMYCESALRDAQPADFLFDRTIKSTRLVRAEATACDMLVDREIKKALSELGTLDGADVAGSELVVLLEVVETEPGSEAQVTLLVPLGAAVGGLEVGGGGVQRQPLELMTPANSATCSSCSLLK